jgi:hypothetical protein
MTFRCGHPRSLENSHRSGGGYVQCAFCKRMKGMVRRVKRDQRRINAGTFFTLGERIARGLA